ncbi:MAG TPA: ATP-binding protein [Longimicrobiales bacterium]
MADRPPASPDAGQFDQGPAPEDRARPSRWELRIPVTFILVSLVTLFIVPILIRQRVDSLRAVIEQRIEPARDDLDALEITFAREGAAIRTFLLTRSPAARALYRRLREIEAEQFRRLEAPGVGPETRLDTLIAELRDRVDAWHATHEALLTGRITAEEYTRLLPPEDPPYERMLRVTEAIDAELARRAQAVLAEMQNVDRFGAVLTIGLALMALVAALTVLRIQQQLQRLARDLRRRAREEKALRMAAEALSAPNTFDAVLAQIASSALLATGSDGAFVEQIDPTRLVVRVVSSAGRYAPPPNTEAPFHGSYAELALARGSPQHVGDVGDPGHRITSPLTATCPECDAVVVPLTRAGDAYGALFVLRAPGRRPFGADDIDRLRIFGNLASLAFRNAKALAESEAARREVERVMESRARLIRGFSHDLKNPLGAADGSLELLEMGVDGELTPKQREGVARGRRSIRAALDLLDEIVELARAEAGQLQLTAAPIDIPELIDATVEEYRAQAEAAGLTLTAEADRPLPIVSCDRARLAQILGNLISNAVKYSPRGGRVTVRARRCDGAPPTATPRGRAHEWVCIDVTDTGPGIPADKQELIFEEFIRLGPSTGAGAGLGLPISRRLARLMRGDITVASEPGRGSTFTIWLPLAAPGEKPRREGPAPPRDGERAQPKRATPPDAGRTHREAA